MMRCDKAGELMSLRLAGMLGDEVERELSSHIEECERCALEWRRFESTQAVLLSWHAPRSPEGLTASILEASERTDDRLVGFGSGTHPHTNRTSDAEATTPRPLAFDWGSAYSTTHCCSHTRSNRRGRHGY